MDQATADTVITDCTAFKKLEGTWITTKATEIVVVKDRATAGHLRIDADVATQKLLSARRFGSRRVARSQVHFRR